MSECGSSQGVPLDLLEPETHIHLTIHRRSGRKVFVGPVGLACAQAEFADAAVTVRSEGAHSQVIGSFKGLPIVRPRELIFMRIVSSVDLTEQPEGQALVSPLLVLSSEI